MATVRRYMRLYRVLISQFFKVILQSKVDFLMGLFGFFFTQIMGIMFLYLVFAQIPDFEPAHAVVVGDSLTSDIKGGLNAGVRTIWFNPKGVAPVPEIPADHEIQKLKDLPELLRRL